MGLFEQLVAITLGVVLSFIAALPALIICAFIIYGVIMLVFKIECYIDDKHHGRK